MNISKHNNNKFLGVPFSEDEVSHVCVNLKNNKAGGLDRIMPEHIKYGGKSVVKALCILFNSIREWEYVHEGFCIAMEVPVFKGKGKDPLSVNSYRKISLMNVIGKVFEQLLSKRLGCVFTDNALGSLQGGGKPNSTFLGTSLILQEAVSYMVEKANLYLWHSWILGLPLMSSGMMDYS